MAVVAAYAAYLNSPQWQERRQAALRRAGFRCEGCPETDGLEVHHLTYERLGFERTTDLMVLCNVCHSQEHGRGSKMDRTITDREATNRLDAKELERTKYIPGTWLGQRLVKVEPLLPHSAFEWYPRGPSIAAEQWKLTRSLPAHEVCRLKGGDRYRG